MGARDARDGHVFFVHRTGAGTGCIRSALDSGHWIAMRSKGRLLRCVGFSMINQGMLREWDGDGDGLFADEWAEVVGSFSTLGRVHAG